MLTVNSYLLTQFQKCKRDYRIGLTHRLTKWNPKSLLSACLRRAVHGLSSGIDSDTVSDTAVRYFLACARDPGLDMPHGMDVYVFAMDFTAIIRNVIEYISRLTLLPLHDVKPVMLSEGVEWQVLSHMDETGTLHRWSFIDYLPEDVMEELHGWDVFGDIAAVDAPMTLHLVAIGKRQGNHQASPWCRVYSHPKIANTYRFNKKSGASLDGDWKTVYFSDNSKNNSMDWVDWMERDNTVDTLVRHVRVAQVNKDYIDEFKHQVSTEATLMVQYGSYPIITVPMSRGACDKPYCRHQEFCYGRQSIDKIGTYTRIGTKAPKPDLVGV